jgi:hypothetical protein
MPSAGRPRRRPEDSSQPFDRVQQCPISKALSCPNRSGLLRAEVVPRSGNFRLPLWPKEWFVLLIRVLQLSDLRV